MFAAPRYALLFVLALVASPLAVMAPAAASAATPLGAPCSAGSGSAMNQYCEDVPSATGGNVAGPGTPRLASHLSPSQVRALRAGAGATAAAGGGGAASFGGLTSSGIATTAGHGRSAEAAARSRAKLLALPAPAPGVRIAETSLPHASSWSLLSALIIVLGVATAGTGGLALLARRRRGSAS